MGVGHLNPTNWPDLDHGVTQPSFQDPTTPATTHEWTSFPLPLSVCAKHHLIAVVIGGILKDRKTVSEHCELQPADVLEMGRGVGGNRLRFYPHAYTPSRVP